MRVRFQHRDRKVLAGYAVTLVLGSGLAFPGSPRVLNVLSRPLSCLDYLLGNVTE